MVSLIVYWNNRNIDCFSSNSLEIDNSNSLFFGCFYCTIIRGNNKHISHQTNLKSLWRPPLVDFAGGSPGGRWSCWWVTGLRSSWIFSGREEFVSNKRKPVWWDGGVYVHGLVEFQGLKVSPFLDFGFRVLACSSNAFACRCSLLCRCSVHKSCHHLEVIMPGSERLEKSVAFVREPQLTWCLGLRDLSQSSWVSTRLMYTCNMWLYIFVAHTLERCTWNSDDIHHSHM